MYNEDYNLKYGGRFGEDQRQFQSYDDRNINVDDVMSVKDWILAFIILSIPIVNVIMYFAWAFSSEINKNKKNFARASLILVAIGLGLGLLFSSFS